MNWMNTLYAYSVVRTYSCNFKVHSLNLECVKWLLIKVTLININSLIPVFVFIKIIMGDLIWCRRLWWGLYGGYRVLIIEETTLLSP